jgi:hypothetical protein
MKASRGLAVAVSVAAGLALTACTDDTGAIDQLGHNGFDRMACTQFATMANDVRHDAMTVRQARVYADQLAATSQRGGDPNIRQAGTDLADAYRRNSPAQLSKAMAEFQSACRWV